MRSILLLRGSVFLSFLFVSCLMLFGQAAFAQTTKVVSGTVADTAGKSVSGASVRAKGLRGGTVTNESGEFKLTVPVSATTLVITSVGFKDTEMPINGLAVVIQLKRSNDQLGDVIVVGYGTQKKATLTGAVETVSPKTFESRAITNVGLALQGASPGLVVTRTSARPGNEGLAFQIRGATSINGGTPLVVIDGVPALNYYSFQNMNADDIESISIIKDGAAAIYGSRGANGVILVTTKRGKGKVKIDYSGNMRFTTNGITAFSPNMQQYATLWIEANKEEAIPNWWGWVDLPTMQKMQQGVEGIYHTQYWGDVFLGNADRIHEMFARRYSYQHNISVSNRTDVSGYRLSLGYADNQATLATAYDGQKQYNLRFNYDYKLSERIKLESAVSLINAATKSPSSGLDASLYGQEQPFYPAKNPYGQWYADYGTVGDRQPVAATSDGGRDNQNDLTMRLDMKATAQIVKGLSFEGMVSFQNERYNRERWVTLVQTYDWYGNPAQKTVTATQTRLSTTEPEKLDKNNPGYLTVANNYVYQYYSGFLKYSKTFKGVHNLSAAAGVEGTKWNGQGVAAARLNFTDLGVQDLNLANNASVATSGGKDVWGTYSYIARLNYNYGEKYLVEGLARRDGNSRFADGFKFKTYGSASLGWIFTRESFAENITSIVNFGKLRASYGTAGNDVGIGNFNYLPTVNPGSVVLGSPAAVQTTSSLANNGLYTNLVSWEKVEQKNIGIDLLFVKSRLSATFDYFIKDNIGMLTSPVYPAVVGATSPKTNSGHLQVKGWEAVIGWKDSKKDFSYNVSFNISNTQNTIKNLTNANSYVAGKNGVLNGTAFVNGYPTAAWFVYKTDGYFQTQKEVDDYYTKYGAQGGSMAGVAKGSASELRPGDTKRVDVSGDGKIYDGGSQTSDLVYKGDGNQHFVFGLNLGGSYKGFDIGALFQGVGKQLIMRNGWMAYPFATIYTNQNTNFLGKTWTASNPGAEFPRLTTAVNRAAWNYANNDFMLQNARYIRLKSLVVGYTLPENISRKAKLERVRIYFSGNDLWEYTNIKDGFDPEMGETSQNSGYPFYRTWSFGLNIGL